MIPLGVLQGLGWFVLAANVAGIVLGMRTARRLKRREAELDAEAREIVGLHRRVLTQLGQLEAAAAAARLRAPADVLAQLQDALEEALSAAPGEPPTPPSVH